jgi:uncharacterized protein (DUF305 family)
MKPRTLILTLTFGGAISLLSLGTVACSNVSKTQQDTAQNSSSTPEMHSGSSSPSLSPRVSPGMSMPGMDHSSMNISLGPKDENSDLRFIDAMTPHHEGAVVMAQEALQKSSRPEIKQLAQSIINAQQKEIAQMKDWRKTWYPSVAATPMMYDAQMGHMMPMSEAMRDSMMSGDLGAADDQFDLRFINAMLPHHEGALTMAKEALEKSDRPEVKRLAQSILDSQQKEIDQMKQWRQEWYGQ